jgi:hypothetical protein
MNYSKWDRIGDDDEDDDEDDENVDNSTRNKKISTSMVASLSPTPPQVLNVLKACELQRAELNEEFYKVSTTAEPSDNNKQQERYQTLLAGYDQIVETITNEPHIHEDIAAQVAVTVVSCWLNGTCCYIKLGRWEEVIGRCEEVLESTSTSQRQQSFMNINSLNDEQMTRIQYFLCFASLRILPSLNKRRLNQLELGLQLLKTKASAPSCPIDTKKEYESFIAEAEAEMEKLSTSKTMNPIPSVDSTIHQPNKPSLIKGDQVSSSVLAKINVKEEFAVNVNEGKTLFEKGNKLEALQSFLRAANLMEPYRQQYIYHTIVTKQVDYIDNCLKKCLAELSEEITVMMQSYILNYC